MESCARESPISPHSLSCIVVHAEDICEPEWVAWYRVTPNPIARILSTMRKHRVQSLLMGGLACVLYGVAEFSRDTDLALPGVGEADLLSLPDLVAAKKTQRDKDWPMLRHSGGGQ